MARQRTRFTPPWWFVRLSARNGTFVRLRFSTFQLSRGSGPRDRLLRSVAAARSWLASLIAPPDPEKIRWVALGGGSLEVGLPGGLAAGDARHWDFRIHAPEEGLLVVFANANVENSVLTGSHDTNVVLSVEVGEIRIARTVVTAASAADVVISTIAPIMISSESLLKPGVLRSRITLKSSDADLTLGDMNAVALFLPATMGHVVRG